MLRLLGTTIVLMRETIGVPLAIALSVGAHVKMKICKIYIIVMTP